MPSVRVGPDGRYDAERRIVQARRSGRGAGGRSRPGAATGSSGHETGARRAGRRPPAGTRRATSASVPWASRSALGGQVDPAPRADRAAPLHRAAAGVWGRSRPAQGRAPGAGPAPGPVGGPAARRWAAGVSYRRMQFPISLPPGLSIRGNRNTCQGPPPRLLFKAAATPPVRLTGPLNRRLICIPCRRRVATWRSPACSPARRS